MRILAADIGAGTEDVLLYDSQKRLENCIRLVLPSPSLFLAERAAALTGRGADLFVQGYPVGGGSFSQALKRHAASGHRVIMSRSAAYSVRNNLDDVRSLGIEIRDEPPAGFDGEVLVSDELDLSPLGLFLDSVGESLGGLDAAAVAVQDHGAYRTGESNRKKRLAQMRSILSVQPDPLALSYLADGVPEGFPRMASAVRRLEEQLDCRAFLVMDTSPAAVAGCLADPLVESRAAGRLLLINAGNGHTLAALLDGGRITAMLEHHTRYLESAEFASYLEAFCAGRAADDDEYISSGHGLFYLEEPPGIENLDLIAVTGPNRHILEESGLEIYYPSPGGDMMMTGPMGLVRALRFKLGGDSPP